MTYRVAGLHSAGSLREPQGGFPRGLGVSRVARVTFFQMFFKSLFQLPFLSFLGPLGENSGRFGCQNDLKK